MMKKENPSRNSCLSPSLACLNRFILKSKTQKKFCFISAKVSISIKVFCAVLFVCFVSPPGSIWRGLICTVNIFTNQLRVTCCFKRHEIISSHHYTTQIVNIDDDAAAPHVKQASPIIA